MSKKFRKRRRNVHDDGNEHNDEEQIEKDKEDEKGETYILTEEVHNIRSEATESFRHLIEFFENSSIP